MSGKRLYNPAVDFQDDAVALENSRPPVLLWIVYGLLVAGILSAILWTCVCKMDRVVTAEGKLVTVRPNIVLKPLERVVIRKVDVRIGEFVKKDQILITFDPTFSHADMERLQLQYDSYHMHALRLRAELAGREFLQEGRTDDRNYERQRVIFLERRRYFNEKNIFYNENIKRLDVILATRKKNLVKQRERLSALVRLEEMFDELHKKQAASLKDLIEMQIQRMQLEGDSDSLEGKIAESEHDSLSACSEKNSFLNQWREDIAKELVQVEREMESVEQQLSKAKRTVALTELRSPCDAIVHEISAFQEGSAVREAEALITLVPLGVDIEARVNVDPRDIGKIALRNIAKIKLDAFPFQRYGTLTGIVRTISEDTIQEPDTASRESKSYYHVQLSVSGRLAPRAENYRLVPGMRVTAEIKIGKRRIIEYLIDPLIKALDESLNEP